MEREVLSLSEETQAQVAGDRLMADILSGVLGPGRKLRIAELKTLYGIGASPLREALSRVASLGYVTTESRRGYRVAAMSKADLADITRSRQVIEAGMLRESMEARHDEWEMDIIASFERLRWTVRKNERGESLTGDQINLAHKKLHLALVGGCTAPRLIAMQDLLFDQAFRYREMMISEVSSSHDFLQKHEKLVEVVLDYDIEKAVRELWDHLNLTLRDVYSAG
jgi:DNA-binding GntR family transcriptional regulator